MSASYYAVIPANVRYCPELSSGAKLLFGEIAAMCDEEGYCFPINNNLATLYNVEVNTISAWVSELVASGFVQSEIDREGGNRRRVALLAAPITKNRDRVTTPLSVEGGSFGRLTHIYSTSSISSSEQEEKNNKETYIRREGEGRETNNENNESTLNPIRRLETRFPYSRLFNEDLTINLLLQQEGFGEAWRTYVRQMRKARKNLTEAGAKKLLSVLTLRPDKATDALKVCAEKGWKTLEWAWLEENKERSLNVKTREPVQTYASASEQRAARGANNHQPRKEPIL